MRDDVTFAAAGRSFTGLLALPDWLPDGAPRGGVLVFHGGGGLAAHERERAGRFAALGYAAFAPDLFGEVFADRAAGMRVIGALVADPDRLRERVIAARDHLAARIGAPVAAVGHCFGGLAALELARSGADVRAAVALHGALTTRAPARPGQVRARVLACTGGDDPFCPREQRAAFEDEMTAAGVDWQHHVYGGARHGFSVPGVAAPGCAYVAAADRRSWAALCALLDEVLV